MINNGTKYTDAYMEINYVKVFSTKNETFVASFSGTSTVLESATAAPTAAASGSGASAAATTSGSTGSTGSSDGSGSGAAGGNPWIRRRRDEMLRG